MSRAGLWATDPPQAYQSVGVARGINIPNVQPDPAGLASVNPIFTWRNAYQCASKSIRYRMASAWWPA
jgi:hypothetical protein